MKLFAALLLFPLVGQAGIAECTIKVINHDSGVKTIEQAIIPPESIDFCVDGIQCFLSVSQPGRGSLLACYLDALANNYLGVDRRSIEEAEPTTKIGFGVNGSHYDIVSACTIRD